MIFPNHKVQFIGIPKCGSYSVWEALHDPNVPQDGKINTHDHWKLKDVQSQYPTYCIIRNPWDRAVSAWNMMPGRGDLYDKLKSDLNEFVFYPQVDFITIDGEIKVDYILKFEELHTEWNKHFNVPLPHSNKTNDKVYSMDDRTYELISLIYRKDIELWNSLKN